MDCSLGWTVLACCWLVVEDDLPCTFDPPGALPAVIAIAEALELAHRDEWKGGYTAGSATNWVRHHLQEAYELPPLGDVEHLPKQCWAQKFADWNYQLKIEWQGRLDAGPGWPLREQLEEAVAAAEHYYDIWWSIYYCHANHHTAWLTRRVYLDHVRDAMGREAYELRHWPQPIPIQFVPVHP